MSAPLQLTKADARRALVRYHFSRLPDAFGAFAKLRSVQFDPIAPAGCNHDLVLQARVPGYRVGDWERLAYGERRIYDGWDKQASLVPYEGWQVRRLFHKRHAANFKRLFEEDAEAVKAVLDEIRERGPLMPSECGIKERRSHWEGTWYGPNLAKRVLRALWHTGQVMTADRRRGQHVYDLTERVVPPHILAQPQLDDETALRRLILERHHALGLLRPTASYEVWSYFYAPERVEAIGALRQEGAIVPVDVEGVKANASPEFLAQLDQPPLEPRVVFVAPLDQILWDRKLVQQVFGFDYIWEIYVPEPKRRWGYYVLPVLFGDRFVARIEFFARGETLEVRTWHDEGASELPQFWPAFEHALREFMGYCGASRVVWAEHLDARVRQIQPTAL